MKDKSDSGGRSLRNKLSKAYWRRFRALENGALKPGNGVRTMVFAPHPDDEVLGCGGTVIQKVDTGADVRIVFMTDGSSSHNNSISASELAAQREREAVEAGRALGVGRDAISFLRFPDRHLSEHMQEAVAKVSALLEHSRPDEVFIPHREESPADHKATYQAVRQALTRSNTGAVVYEYPVWLWFHWPWVPVRQRTKQQTLQVLKNTLLTGAGWEIWKGFNTSVDISAVKERKWAALEKHQSQMRKPAGDKNWPVLGDVAGGQFLDCFFQDRELFLRYQVGEEDV